MRGADAIRQDEREPARRRLVDDDAPRLVRREQGEHVGDRIALRDAVPFDVRQHDEAHALGARERLQPRSLGAAAREEQHEPTVGRGRDGPDERVEALLRREPRDGEDGDVVGRETRLGPELLPARRERVRPLRRTR